MFDNNTPRTYAAGEMFVSAEMSFCTTYMTSVTRTGLSQYGFENTPVNRMSMSMKGKNDPLYPPSSLLDILYFYIYHSVCVRSKQHSGWTSF